GHTGADSFTFVARDRLNTSVPAIVLIDVPDQLPSADGGTPYTYAVQPGGSTSWTAAAGVLSRATDPYGYSLTASLVSGPSNGNWPLNDDGSFTYTPNANFTGPDTFTFQADDGVAPSLHSTVTINVGTSERPAADSGAAYSYVLPRNQMLTTSADD